jgi:hypothetical protein
LTWAPTPLDDDALSDPDRLIERTRIGYGIALTVYALANLSTSVFAAFGSFDASGPQLALTIVAAAITVAAVPAILNRYRPPPWLVTTALITTALVQSALVPANELGTQRSGPRARSAGV